MVANATATSCACASETIQTQLFVPLVVCFFVFATALLMGGTLLAVQVRAVADVGAIVAEAACLQTAWRATHPFDVARKSRGAPRRLQLP